MWPYIVCGIVALIVVFIFWRYTSVARGARQRDERLLKTIDPIAMRFEKQEQVSAEEIATLNAQPQYRRMLFALLNHYKRLDLLPAEAWTIEGQGAGALAYWLMHPNEMNEAPEHIEVVEKITHEINKEPTAFIVYRFRMPPNHWSSKKVWQLGLAGPFYSDGEPYQIGAFSRGDDADAVTPASFVDWYAGMLQQKFGA